MFPDELRSHRTVYPSKLEPIRSQRGSGLLQMERLDTDDAVVLGDHPCEFRWREPTRVQPLQVCVGRPTGDGAALSDVDGNLVVQELLQELFRRRNADALD